MALRVNHGTALLRLGRRTAVWRHRRWAARRARRRAALGFRWTPGGRMFNRTVADRHARVMRVRVALGRGTERWAARRFRGERPARARPRHPAAGQPQRRRYP